MTVLELLFGGVYLDIFINIIVMMSISVLSSFSRRNSAAGMIVKIGLSKKFYPSHHTRIPAIVQKFLKISMKSISKYLYIQLLVSIFFLMLGPINILVYICTGFQKNIFGILVMVHACFVIINLIIFSLISFLYSR